MTVSSTPCCRSEHRTDTGGGAAWWRAAAVLRRALLIACLVCAGGAQAGTVEPLEASLSLGDEAYVLSARFRIELGPHLEEAVSRGVPLYFMLEFNLQRSRWYWSNEQVAGKIINYRLAYNALTRQYRLSSGGVHQNFATLGEALKVMARVGALPVADKAALKSGETYQASLRLSHDWQQLPKPFQVDAIANRDWQVGTTTLNWQFVAAAAPVESAGK